MKSDKITVEVDIERLVEQLPSEDKMRLVHKLEKEMWGKRIDNLLKRIDQRRKKYPISQKEISKEIEAVRKEIYGKGNH